MGKGEKQGFPVGRLITIILVVVLVALAAILIWVYTVKGGPEELFRRKRKAPPLKPTVMIQQLYSPDYQSRLELVDRA